jgi:hypothetical protein
MKVVISDEPVLVGFALTQEEIDMIEALREWSADPNGIRFTASFESDAWECTLQDQDIDAKEKWRGVGRSFVEAFCNLDGQDIEAP